METDAMITVFTETLFHFSCSHCKKWWTIGDWDWRKFLTCPHCGELQEIKEHGDSEDEFND